MTDITPHDIKIAALTLAAVYPAYVNKVERKGRTRAELQQVITWLTGLDEAGVAAEVARKSTFADLFDRVTVNPKANQITGVICGYRVEDIANPLTQKIRYLDKLVDELAKGRKMEKILRDA